MVRPVEVQRASRLSPTEDLDSPRKQRTDQQQDERHSYEKCQYDEFKKRVAKMDELREAKGGERSN